MIQRIQSVFLLVVLLLFGMLFFKPLADLKVGGIVYGFFPYGIKNTEFQSIPLLVLHVIIISITLVTIFLFKNRSLQMRLCVYNILLMIGFAGLTYFYYHSGTKFLEEKVDEGVVRSFTLIAANPLLSIILTYLAFRNILKDDVLVKSADRIR